MCVSVCVWVCVCACVCEKGCVFSIVSEMYKGNLSCYDVSFERKLRPFQWLTSMVNIPLGHLQSFHWNTIVQGFSIFNVGGPLGVLFIVDIKISFVIPCCKYEILIHWHFCVKYFTNIRKMYKSFQQNKLSHFLLFGKIMTLHFFNHPLLRSRSFKGNFSLIFLS